MNDLLAKPLVRAGIVAGLTYLAYRHLPAGVGKTLALAIGGMATTSVLSQSFPLIGNVLQGQLPVAAA